MAVRKSLLVVEGGGEPLEPIARRLVGLGFHVVRAKTPRDAHELLRDPRFLLGAVVVPSDLPAPDLADALHALRAGGRGSGALPLLACGSRPDATVRERLRRVGVEHALWFPLDDHTLRFQANRALAGSEHARMRRSERVPTNWPVSFRLSGREKLAKIYTLSACGAYLATAQPSLPRTLVHVQLPLPGHDARVAAEVMMTNVPGNLAKGNLPVGMGVRFRGLDDDTEAALLAYTLERGRALKV